MFNITKLRVAGHFSRIYCGYQPISCNSQFVAGKSWGTKHQRSTKTPFPMRQKPMAPNRKWNVSSTVQMKLREEFLEGPEFRNTTFKTGSQDMPKESMDRIKEILSAIPGHMRETLGDLSRNDFNACLEFIASSPIQGVTQETREILPEVCSLRLASLSLKEQLKMTDILYQIGCLSEYLMTVFYQSLATHWDTQPITKSNILQLLFYIGNYRDAPAVLLEKIESYLLKNSGQFNGNEMGLVCHAFFACNRAIHDLELLQTIAKKTVDDFSIMGIDMVCNVMKVMRQGDYNDANFYIEVGNKLCENRLINSTYSLPSLANIVSAFSSARISHQDLFDEISKRTLHVITRSSRAPRMKDLARILSGFHALHHECHESVLNNLHEQISKDMDLLELYPLVYIQSILVLLLNGHCPEESVHAVLSYRNLRRLKGRSLEQNYQMLLINSLVKTYHTGYKGHLLDEREVSRLRHTRDGRRELDLHVRQGLAATWLTLEDILGESNKVCCHYITDFTSIPDLEMKIDEDGRACDGTPLLKHADEEKVKDQLRRKFSQAGMDTDEDGVMAQVLREYGRTDKESLPGEHLLPARRSKTRRITIKIMSEKQYLRNTSHLTGTHMAELNLLNAMGYEVLTITPQEARKVDQASPEGRRTLVKTLIIDRLDFRSDLSFH